MFETKIKQDEEFKQLRSLYSAEYKWLNPKTGNEESNENRLYSYLITVSNEQLLSELNDNFFLFTLQYCRVQEKCLQEICHRKSRSVSDWRTKSCCIDN